MPSFASMDIKKGLRALCRYGAVGLWLRLSFMGLLFVLISGARLVLLWGSLLRLGLAGLAGGLLAFARRVLGNGHVKLLWSSKAKMGS